MSTNDQLSAWAAATGFSRSCGLYRGSVNPFHKASVTEALKNMGLVMVLEKDNVENWVTSDGVEEAVIVTYG